MQPSDDVLRDIHRRMVRIRIFEQEAGKLMEAGKIPGALHLYVGEEAVAAALWFTCPTLIKSRARIAVTVI